MTGSSGQIHQNSLQHTQQTIQLLQSPGWTINWKNSMLDPSRILDFLGLHFNLGKAIISPPDSPGLRSAHQLAGARGHPISWSSVGTSVVQSDCLRVLWQQYCSGLHTQTGRDAFHIPVQQNSGTLSSSGPVRNSSHSDSPTRSQEFNCRCTVLAQQSKPDRMEAASRNLTQSVLCFRDPPSGHVQIWRLILYLILPVTFITLNGRPSPSGPMTKASSPGIYHMSLWQSTLYICTQKTNNWTPSKYTGLP